VEGEAADTSGTLGNRLLCSTGTFKTRTEAETGMKTMKVCTDKN